MRIKGYGLPHRAGKNVLLPPRFEATEETKDGFTFTVMIEADGKAPPRCTKVTVEPADPNARIGSTVFRTHSISGLIDRAVASAAIPVEIEEVGEGVWRTSPVETLSRDQAEEIWEDIREPHRGAPIRDEHLAAVGKVYGTARASGMKPPQLIANEMHASLATAYRWIERAKKAGYIKD